MAVFELKYELGIEYDNKVELDIRLKTKPSSEDNIELLTALETLDSFARKYLDLKIKPVIKEAK